MSEFLKGLRGVNYSALEDVLNKQAELLQRPHNQIYLDVLEQVKEFSPSLKFEQGEIDLGQVTEANQHKFTEVVKKLIPWRKGPFRFGPVHIDSEWRSDHKWQRILDAGIELAGKRVLDVGSNNGYFMFRMLEHDPKWVYGIDPVPHYWAQFELLKHLSGDSRIHYDLLGVEHLGQFEEVFDTVFFMGIIYHHRHPLAQLKDIKDSMTPGGEIIFETLGIPGDESICLFPEDRYAGMRNVWFVPSAKCMHNWLKRSHFVDIELVSQIPTTSDEQRWTPWINESAPSLKDFLDPDDPTKTVEGYPAPDRIMFRAKKKGGR